MSLWPHIRRAAVRLIASLGVRPVYTQAELDAFLESRAWLAVRREAAMRLDRSFDVLLRPESGHEAMATARGAVWALQWMLEPEEVMRRLVVADESAVVANMSAERKLREVMDLAERRRTNVR